MHVAVADGRPAERSLAFSVAVELFEPLWQATASPALRAGLADGPAAAAVGLLEARGPTPSLGDGGYAITRGMWALARRLAEQPLRDERPSPPAAGHPGLAIIVDDLQDVDAATLGLLAYAAERLDSSSVAIVAGCRCGVESAAPAAITAIARAARVFAPERLDARTGAALVSSLLPRASMRFVAACVEVCGGNAALLHRLVAGLGAHGLTGSDADADRVGAALPDGISSLAAERLSRLPAMARALARAVAASDGPVGLEQVAARAGLTTEAALKAVDVLEEADVLIAGRSPAFAQPIMRTAVRASLTAGQRARLAPPVARPAGVVGRERLGTLTPGEDRVAGLAAHGMTTRQIAETLFVTPKTVEFHLRNVYAKLEIPSTRAALARALEVPEPLPSAE